MQYKVDWHITGDNEKPKGGEDMDEKFYVVEFSNALIEIRERGMEISPEDEVLAALYIMQEMAKDRRMGMIAEDRAEERGQKASRQVTAKQKAFLAKHCGIPDFNGTFEDASSRIDGIMREKGWGKYSK